MTLTELRHLTSKEIKSFEKNFYFDDEQGYMSLEIKGGEGATNLQVMNFDKFEKKWPDQLTATDSPNPRKNMPQREPTPYELITFLDVAHKYAPESRMTKILETEAEKMAKIEVSRAEVAFYVATSALKLIAQD